MVSHNAKAENSVEFSGLEPRSGEGRNSGRDVGTEIAEQSEDRVAGGTKVKPHSP
ncbi:MAG: hypothetical protein KBS36_02895 [Bacteroidales bacterium]|nr:hypothetical protein [Candidatus Cryptobacteroides fimicaballi]